MKYKVLETRVSEKQGRRKQRGGRQEITEIKL